MKTVIKTLDCIESYAIFSECGKYRFVLARAWDLNKPRIMFIGLNPSTANAEKDDPTIRRVKTIAKNLGYGGVFMLNCFPYVSTDPTYLDDFGKDEENEMWLLDIAGYCSETVFAWGNFPIVVKAGKLTKMCGMFPNAKALHINKNGSPKHPLYVKSDTQLVTFNKK